MGLDEVEDLWVAWESAPPAHMALARIDALLCAFFGVRREADERPASESGISSESTPTEIADFISRRLH